MPPDDTKSATLPLQPPTAPATITSPAKAIPPRITALRLNETPLEGGTASPLSVPSDDEELQGAHRLVADPDSPTSRLMERAARRSLQEAANGTPERRFSFINDIARNPLLAQAARLEMDAASGHSSPLGSLPGSLPGGRAGHGSAGGGGLKDGTNTTATTSGGAVPSVLSRVAFFQHATDIDRQAALIDQIDRETDQESKINAGMACVMLNRLESGRAAAERVLSVLQALNSAEAAFARAMAAASDIKLQGEADGPSMRSALATFSELPRHLSLAHAGVSNSVVPAVRLVQSVVSDLRAACGEIGVGAQSAQRTVNASRGRLQTALASHREACKAFDIVLVDRQRAGSRSRSVEADPWVAEGRLVEGQAALQGALTHQRRYLAGAFRRVGELERRRVDSSCNALSSFVSSSILASSCLTLAESVASALADVDYEGDLEAFSAVAADSVHDGDILSARQADIVDHLWRELLSSAEIVRQGEVELMGGGGGGGGGGRSGPGWRPGYAILTRAGFLHWFSAPKECEGEKEREDAGYRGSGGSSGVGAAAAWGTGGGPAASLNLARCEFEAGEAPCWRLIEAASGGLNSWLGGRGTTQTLRTRDVEECMDWTADVREVITACAHRRS